METCAFFAGAHKCVVHRILSIDMVARERPRIAAQGRELAENVEASLSKHHVSYTKPSTELFPLKRTAYTDLIACTLRFECLGRLASIGRPHKF